MTEVTKRNYYPRDLHCTPARQEIFFFTPVPLGLFVTPVPSGLYFHASPAWTTFSHQSRLDYIFTPVPPGLHFHASPAWTIFARQSRLDYIFTPVPPGLIFHASPAWTTFSLQFRQTFSSQELPNQNFTIPDAVRKSSGNQLKRSSISGVHKSFKVSRIVFLKNSVTAFFCRNNGFNKSNHQN